MSDDVKDKEKDKATPEAAPATAAAPAAAAPVVLIAVVALALGAGAALGGMLLAPRLIHARQAAAAAELADPNHKKDKKDSKDKKDKKDKKGETGKAPVYKLDNIIVNPADSDGQRFLMCTVAIESDDAKALDQLREHEIELRDRVVSLLGRQSMDRLSSQAARDSLRTDLLGVILPVLGPEGKDVALKIYLPQFVVQ